MCIIYVCQTGRPDMDELEAGAWRNDDGAGVAWLGKDKKDELIINWKKGFEDHKDVSQFLDDMKIQFPYVIHFRTASVGGKNPALCHPFPVAEGAPLWLEGTANEVLFHNGHVTNWDDVTLQAGLASDEDFPDGPWSDTRALAWLVHLKGQGIIPFVSGTSRVVLFHSDPAVEEGVDYNPCTDHFTTFGAWIHEPKLGYSQSTTVTRGWKNNHTAGFHGNRELASGPVVDVEVISGSTTSLFPTAPAGKQTKDMVSIWTVKELEDVLATIEKEQNDARLAAGI